MYRDVTEIPEVNNCIKVIDDKTIIVYTNENTSLYKLLSYKYYKTESYEPNTPTTETVCFTYAQVSTIPSPFDFVTPIYHLGAIASAGLLFYFAYKLILHPWWRKRA